MVSTVPSEGLDPVEHTVARERFFIGSPPNAPVFRLDSTPIVLCV
jgi:hypothetical protein